MSYLLVFLIVGILVFVHELGHYVAARLVGIRVARLSFGIGGPLVSIRVQGTEYRISKFPFGGYVMPEPAMYFSHSPLKRLTFALGGPVGNIVAAFVLAAIFNCGASGWSATSMFVLPLEQTAKAVELVAGAVPHLLFGVPQVVGPLGVLAEGGTFVGSDLLLALQFATVMSVNLAVLNLIPIPPLDGGRILLCAAEAVSNRAARLHLPLNLAGFVLLVVFLWWVTASDLRRVLVRIFA